MSPTLLSISLLLNSLLVAAAPRQATTHGQVAARSLYTKRQVDWSSSSCSTIFTESNDSLFRATDVRDCLRTIPFFGEPAAQFIQYYRDTMIFQSTLEYLADPPSSYQQPGVDVMARLDQIDADIINGVYQNQYEFESALYDLVHDMHDGNVNLDIGGMSVFNFGSKYAISAVSSDGKELPKPYITNDLIGSQAQDADWSASPIKEINGQDAVEYLTEYAAGHASGFVDPHADWNSLMYSPAGEIQSRPTYFTGGSSFYPGEWLNFTLANGTDIPTSWLSIASVPDGTPAIQSSLDFYYYFVLGINPASINEDSQSSRKPRRRHSTQPTLPKRQDDSNIPQNPMSWNEATGKTVYPGNPIVVEQELGFGGVVTGYFLDDDKTAVLSIPSFESYTQDPESFTNAIADFIMQSKMSKKEKIIIDVQQNYQATNEALAAAAFKQFFPSLVPFSGNRMRVSKEVQALGETFTRFWAENRNDLNQTYEAIFTALPWAVLNNVDAKTGEYFTSFGEFYGPHEEGDGLYSSVQRTYMELAGSGMPYSPDDIIILTDSICHGACAGFVERMHNDAGVRTVTVGGRPNTGPVPAVAGTRGAMQYNTEFLDDDMAVAADINETARQVLPDSHLAYDLLYWVNAAIFNPEDRIRAKDKNKPFPLQFAYEAANCRIYWTPETFNNFEKLWQHAAAVSWDGSEKCVEDSVTATDYTTDRVGPTKEQKQKWGAYIPITQKAPSNSSLVSSAQNLTGRGFPAATKPLKPLSKPPGILNLKPAAQMQLTQQPPRYANGQAQSVYGKRCDPTQQQRLQGRTLYCVSLRGCTTTGAQAAASGVFLNRCINRRSCSSNQACISPYNAAASQPFNSGGGGVGSPDGTFVTTGDQTMYVSTAPKYCIGPSSRPDRFCPGTGGSLDPNLTPPPSPPMSPQFVQSNGQYMPPIPQDATMGQIVNAPFGQ